MRIRVLQTPTVSAVDGIDLQRFRPRQQYEVGNNIGALFLAEGWAEPVASEEPGLVIPISEFVDAPHENAPRNLIRETFPPYYDAPPGVALDRRRRRRSSK